MNAKESDMEAPIMDLLATAWSEGYRAGLMNMEFYSTPATNPYGATK